jgi:hypothetical protein
MLTVTDRRASMFIQLRRSGTWISGRCSFTAGAVNESEPDA